MDKPHGKRYIINSFSNADNKVQLFLSLNKRALAYNQLTGIENLKILSSMINIQIPLRIYEKDYFLYLEKVEIADLYVYDFIKIEKKNIC